MGDVIYAVERFTLRQPHRLGLRVRVTIQVPYWVCVFCLYPLYLFNRHVGEQGVITRIENGWYTVEFNDHGKTTSARYFEEELKHVAVSKQNGQ
jgi:hypothetical protein